MSTRKAKSPLGEALATVPAQFRRRLIDAYESLKRNNLESRYDSAGIAAGKFCEVVLRLLQQAVTGSFTPFGTKIPNFADECRRLIGTPASSAIESLRVIIPRGLVFMYSLRSKRGIGHIGGDVEANRIDLATLTRLADWIVCELIRIYHGLSLEEAQDMVDSLSMRQLLDIWEVVGRKRVIREGLTASQQSLLLLYSDPNSFLLVEDLCNWVEYSRLSMFKRKIIVPLHRKRFLEFDKESEAVYLSPLGVREVENSILPKKSSISSS